MRTDFAMQLSLTDITGALAEWVITYGLHSTLLLSLTWLALRRPRRSRSEVAGSRSRSGSSHALHERLWRFAAAAGVFTATLQLATGTGWSPGGMFVPDVPAIPSAPPEPPPRVAADSPEAAAAALAALRSSWNQLSVAADALATSALAPPVDPAAGTTPPSQVAPPRMPPSQAPLLQDAGLLSRTAVPGENPVGLAEPQASPELSLAPAPAPVPEAVAERSSDAVPGFRTVLGSLAAVWFLAGLLLLAGQSWCFRRLLRSTRPALWPQTQRLNRLCQELGITRRIELLAGDRFPEPVAFGLIDWRIVLPRTLDHRLTDAELDSLLVHEIAHLMRGDLLWLQFGRLLTTCLAFQPLNFLARRRWQLHAEFQCDDWAVARSIDAVTLARGLTVVAEWRSSRSLAPGLLPAGGRRSHLTDRVERLLADRAPDAWATRLRRIFLGATGVTVAGLLTTFGPTAADRLRAGDTPGSVNSSVVQVAPIDPIRGDVSNRAELLQSLSAEAAALQGEINALTTELRELEPLLTPLTRDPALEARIRHLRSTLQRLGTGIPRAGLDTSWTPGFSDEPPGGDSG